MGLDKFFKKQSLGEYLVQKGNDSKVVKISGKEK